MSVKWALQTKALDVLYVVKVCAIETGSIYPYKYTQNRLHIISEYLQNVEPCHGSKSNNAAIPPPPPPPPTKRNSRVLVFLSLQTTLRTE